MSKFHDFQGPLQKFQAWKPKFQIPVLSRFSRTCVNPVTLKEKKWQTMTHINYTSKELCLTYSKSRLAQKVDLMRRKDKPDY